MENTLDGDIQWLAGTGQRIDEIRLFWQQRDDFEMSWRQLFVGHACHGTKIIVCHFCSWKMHPMGTPSGLLELYESLDAIRLLFCGKGMTLK